MKLAADISVRACEFDGLVFEQYAYTPGAIEPIPKHSHEAYQFALSFDHQGEYTYRGEKHQIPPGRLSIIHSGEVHAPSDRTHLFEPAHFAMANIHPKWLNQVMAEITGCSSYDPFFASVLPKDLLLNRLFMTLSTVSMQQSSRLVQEVALWNFFSCLIGRYALNAPSDMPLTSHRAILRACEYLRAHCRRDVSLKELADVVGLSRFHFCRLFRQQVGVSAGAYQLQLRLTEAKKMMIKGRSLAEVAIATGFYDQSHFSRHFKRYVGTTPAKYTGQPD